jgi:hypothetical protein
MKSMRRKWREGKVRPTPGNSLHNRLVSRGFFHVLENLRRSIGPMWFENQNRRNLRVGNRLPLVGPRASVKDATEGARLGSSSAMSSGWLFLDGVARQQSPSPLHRHPQINVHSLVLLGHKSNVLV